MNLANSTFRAEVQSQLCGPGHHTDSYSLVPDVFRGFLILLLCLQVVLLPICLFIFLRQSLVVTSVHYHVHNRAKKIPLKFQPIFLSVTAQDPHSSLLSLSAVPERTLRSESFSCHAAETLA